MSDSPPTSITIIKEVPFFGPGDDTLEARLRRVSLRGFPDVKIYSRATFRIDTLPAADIPSRLHTPQPKILQTHLDRISRMAGLFARHGIDIFQLTSAYDYRAVSDSGEITTWTILPPAVESFQIPPHPFGGYDYAPLIGPEARAAVAARGWDINPQVCDAVPAATNPHYHLIIDGSHRVYAGYQRRQPVSVLEISGVTPGFPYYAVPQPYSWHQIYPSEELAEDKKIHIITAPGHKFLYRDFPSSGIMSGTVRPPRPGETIV